MTQLKVTKLDKARAQIVIDYPFFASLLLRRELQARNDIPTMCVDARNNIYYNPKFVESLEVQDLVTVLLHEVGHIIGNHALRVGARDKKSWQMAADLWVNDTLRQAGVRLMPGMPQRVGAGDMTVDELYKQLEAQKQPESDGGGKGKGKGKGKNKPEQGGGGSGDGSGGDGSGDGGGSDPLANDLDPDNSGGGMDESERDAVEGETKMEIAQAAQAAKMRGKLPANIERLVDKMLHVKTPWFEILERFMTDKAKNDYNWARPNRRYMSSDMFMPAIESVNSMGEVVIGIDTSGSIGERELRCFAGHINRIIELTNPDKVHIIYCDARINHYDVFSRDQYPITLKPYGGGGTDMVEIFRYMKKKGIEPACTIILTDGYTPFPDKDLVNSPTMWAISTDVKAPEHAGETIHFEITDIEEALAA